MVTQTKISPQANAKLAQGYTDTPRNCGNCACVVAKISLGSWEREQNRRLAAFGGEPLFTEKQHGTATAQRCGFSEIQFAVKKTATCDQWRAKVAP
jgi:hypothetical protein